MKLSDNDLKTLSVLMASAKEAEATLQAHFTKALVNAGVVTISKFWACIHCGSVYPKDTTECAECQPNG